MSKSQRDIQELQAHLQQVINNVNHLNQVMVKMATMVAAMHQSVFPELYDDNGDLLPVIVQDAPLNL
jgi:hypothetical protein